MGFLIAEVGLPSGKGATQKIYFLIPFCLENEADKKNKWGKVNCTIQWNYTDILSRPVSARKRPHDGRGQNIF